MRGRSQGFSLVELVAVLILLGILGAVIMPRFADQGVFKAAVLRDGLVAQFNVARQMALGQGEVWVTLSPAPDAARTWQLQVELDDNQLITLPLGRLAQGGLPLSADVNQPASCGTVPGADPITSTSPLTLRYNWLGDLQEGGIEGSANYEDDTIKAVRICIDNNPNLSICLSSAGFAYPGDCDV